MKDVDVLGEVTTVAVATSTKPEDGLKDTAPPAVLQILAGCNEYETRGRIESSGVCVRLRYAKVATNTKPEDGLKVHVYGVHPVAQEVATSTKPEDGLKVADSVGEIDTCNGCNTYESR